MSVLPQSQTPTARDEKAPWWDCPEFAAAFPSLFELLSAPEAWGKPRQPASINLFVHGGKLKAAVNDWSSWMVLYVTIDPSERLYAVLDAALAQSDADWRPMKGDPSKKKKAPF